MRGGNVISLTDKGADNSNNRAILEFTQPERDARLFSTWYSPETIKYLLHSSINASRCLRYVFYDSLQNTDSFSLQLEHLITLGIKLDRPIIFVSKEPGNSSHWVSGLVWKNNLFLFNPLGLTKQMLFYETLAKLQKHHLGKVLFSNTQIQFDLNGHVSCGPLCAEWVMQVSEEEETLRFLLSVFEQELNQETKGLRYAIIDVSSYLSNFLRTLTQPLSPEAYQEKLLRLRANHLEVLQSRGRIQSETTLNCNLDHYWQNCLEAPEQQLMFRLDPDSQNRLHFNNIEQDPLYQRLQQSFHRTQKTESSLSPQKSLAPSVSKPHTTTYGISSASVGNVSLLSSPRKNSLQGFDVPADGTCLFYCVMFSVLLPLVENAEMFQTAFLQLFGEQAPGAPEEIRQILLGYDGSSNFINRNEAQLEVLVDIHFRKRIVDFMRANKEMFQDFYYEDETFEERLAKIEKPKAWGDETEIQAISLFLKRRVRVYQEKEETQDYGKEYDQNSAIRLVFVSASGQKGDAKNHYHFQLDKKYIPNLPKGHIDVGNESKKMFPTILSADHQTIQKNSPLKKAADEIEAARKDCNDNLKKTAELLRERSSSELLKEAEKNCVKALQSANKLEGSEKQQALSVGFEMLGDIYSKRGCLFEKDLLKRHREKLKAVTLYNIALASKTQYSEGSKNLSELTSAQQPLDLNDNQKQLIQKIQQIEQVLILSSGGKLIEEAVEAYWEKIQSSKNILMDIREKARAVLEKENIFSPIFQTIYQPVIQRIYQKIAFGLRESLVKKLMEDCFQLLLLPEGCVYSIMVLGSIAREEATPYSDFEWAILIEDQGEEKNQKHKEYFRRLTELVWIKVLNLGETTARMMDIESLSWFSENESPTKKGFSFDGQMMDGCHTPLGNKHHTEKDGQYELIGTPKELAEFQQNNWESKRGFQTVLSTVDLIISNDIHLEKSLIEVYEENMSAIWATTSKEEDKKTDEMISRTLIQKRSLKFLAESVERFQFRGGKFDKECHYFDAKYHLYRLPNMVIDHLASYFYFDGVKTKNLWDRIEEIFGKSGVVSNPKGEENLRIAISKILGLRLLAYLNKGYRHDYILTFDLEHPEKNRAFWGKYLGVNQNVIIDIYAVFIPLQDVIKEFTEKNGLIEVLLRSCYYDIGPDSKAYFFHRSLDYSNASAGYKKSIEFFTAMFGPKNLFLARSLNDLGNLYQDQGKYADALEVYEEARRITIAVYDDEAKHIEVADVLNGIGCVYQAQGEYAKAIEIYEEAKEIITDVYGPKHTNLVDILNNVGLVYHAQRRCADALAVYEEAKEIITNAYGPKHTKLANILNNVGRVHHVQRRYVDALMFYKEAEQINTEVYGTDHILVADTLRNVGGVYQAQGRYAEAIEAYEKAKRIKIKVYGPEHINMVGILNDLGLVAIEQRRFSDARIFFRQAFDIYTQFDHPNKTLTNSNLLLSFLREGNLYLLQKEVDIRKTQACYQQFDPSLDPSKPETHQDLANQLYESNQLSGTIEHYRILLWLKPDAASAHHNLACMLHIRAQIEKDKGHEAGYQAYLKEAQEHFEEAIRLDPHTGVYAEYAQFMWKNRVHYSLEFIINMLQKSIDLGQIDKGLMYGLMERPTVDENLQWLIDDEKEISFKAYFLAYYLLIQIYCADHQLKSAQALYIEFKQKVTIFVESVLVQQTQLDAQIKALIEAEPEQESEVLQQGDQIKFQTEKELGLLNKLLEFSHQAIDALKISVLSEQGQYEELLSLLFLCSKLDIAYLPERLLLSYLQMHHAEWNLETCRLYLGRLIESSDSLLVKLEEKEEGQTVYAMSSVTQNVINGDLLIKPPFFLSLMYEEKQRTSFKTAAKLLFHYFNEKEMTQAIAFNANVQWLPHVDALLSFFPDLSRENDVELVNLLLPLFKTRCFMWLSMGDKRAQVPIEARSLRRALVSYAKLNEKVDSVAMIYKKLASVHSDWPRHYAALLYILGRTHVHRVFNERGSIERTDYFEQCIDVCSVMEKQTGQCPDYRYLSKRSLLSLRCNNLDSLSLRELERLLQEYEDLLSDSTVYWNEEGKTLRFDTDLFNQRVCRRKLALICMELGVRSSNTEIIGEYFQKAANYLTLELKLETGSVVFELEAENCNTLGQIYHHCKNPNRNLILAEKYFNEAYQTELAKNDGKGKRDFPLADVAYGLAQIALEQGHLPKARHYAELCSSIREEIGSSKLAETKKLLEEINAKQSASKEVNTSPSSLFAVSNSEDHKKETSVDDPDEKESVTDENRRETNVTQTIS